MLVCIACVKVYIEIIETLLFLYHWCISPAGIYAEVTLEYDSHQESNNTLITMDSIGEEENILFCSTDREDCCTQFDEFGITGSWFLPDGSMIHVQSSINNTQSLHITLGIQTIGLNITNNPEMPTGIYRCEMMDRDNVTHYLYAGIYPENEGMTSY